MRIKNQKDKLMEEIKYQISDWLNTHAKREKKKKRVDWQSVCELAKKKLALVRE